MKGVGRLKINFMKLKPFKYFAFIVLSLIAMQACKTRQIADKPTIKGSAEQMIEKIKKAEPKFSTANVSRMNIALKLNDRTVNVNASCRIIADSAIHVSVQPMLGIEMFKAEISKDSILLFDKMNRRMYAIAYDYFESRMGIALDFNTIQSVIAQHFFSLPTADLKLWQNDDAGQQIYVKLNNMQQETSFDAKYVIDAHNITAKDALIQIKYADRADFSGRNFPKTIEISANNRNQIISMIFGISRLSFDEVINMNTMDITRYRRENIEELLKK